VTRDPVIVGVGLSDYPRAPHLTSYGHHALAMQRALADCGVALADIDGYMTSGTNGMSLDDVATMSEYLGVRARLVDGTQTGGGGFERFVELAAQAIRAGLSETVLITYGSDLRSNKRRSIRPGGGPFVEGPGAWEAPYGATIVGNYAMIAQRHMHEFGTTAEHLAEIAVSTRLHAASNPLAPDRTPLSIADVVNAPRVADPLGRYDCCLVTDGGGAVIMTTAERARDLRQKPIHVLGAATASTHWSIGQMPDLTTTGAVDAAQRAFAQAGLRPGDMDFAQIYDSFTITVLMMLEGLGFCGRGEGGAFVQDGRLRPGGLLPVNTDGGGLSACHPGMRGIFLLIESVRQLRGQAGDAQVPGARFGVACGSGGTMSFISAAILGSERP
jgi:acetyl-CoA acetyltransferase